MPSRKTSAVSVAPLVALVFMSGLLAACSGTGGGEGGLFNRSGGGGGLFSRASSEDGSTVNVGGQEFDASVFLESGYCPPIEIRSGGQALITYERGHEGDSEHIAFQGSITRTARECTALGPDRLAIKVGVAGRIVAGPKGSAANVTVPITVSVVKQHGAEVRYRETFRFPASVTPPAYGADYSQVIDQVVVPVGPGDRDLVIFVGFDNGTPGEGNQPTG